MTFLGFFRLFSPCPVFGYLPLFLVLFMYGDSTGYCDERHGMMLVYEFMENGTLRDHLYKLEWGLHHVDSLITTVLGGLAEDQMHNGVHVHVKDLKVSAKEDKLKRVNSSQKMNEPERNRSFLSFQSFTWLWRAHRLSEDFTLCFVSFRRVPTSSSLDHEKV